MKIKTKVLASLLILSILVSCSSEIKQDRPKPAEQTINNSQIHTQALPQDPPKFIYPHPNTSQQAEPKWVEKRPLSYKERFSGVLDSHNRVRAKHRLPPLKWSNNLAKYSQAWANQLGSGNKCQMYHRDRTPFGENLYRSTAIVWTDGRREINPVSIKQVVKAWTDEERWYDYSRNRCQPGQQCGHYTQVVWKDTKEVGCAMQVCADKSQTWVCSYNPPGNYVGIRPY